eukprot:6000608-Pyramimonas_sp.AAC.1
MDTAGAVRAGALRQRLSSLPRPIDCFAPVGVGLGEPDAASGARAWWESGRDLRVHGRRGPAVGPPLCASSRASEGPPGARLEGV